MSEKLNCQPPEHEEWRKVAIAGFGEFAVRATDHDSAMLKLSYFAAQVPWLGDLRPDELLPCMHASAPTTIEQSTAWRLIPSTPSVHLRTIIDHSEPNYWPEPAKPADMEEMFEQQSLLQSPTDC